MLRGLLSAIIYRAQGKGLPSGKLAHFVVFHCCMEARVKHTPAIYAKKESAPACMGRSPLFSSLPGGLGIGQDGRNVTFLIGSQ